jgi:hypothetical protein
LTRLSSRRQFGQGAGGFPSRGVCAGGGEFRGNVLPSAAGAAVAARVWARVGKQFPVQPGVQVVDAVGLGQNPPCTCWTGVRADSGHARHGRTSRGGAARRSRAQVKGHLILKILTKSLSRLTAQRPKCRLAVVQRLPWIKRQRDQLQAALRQSEREMVTGESHYVWGGRHRLKSDRTARPRSFRGLRRTPTPLRVPGADLGW